MTSVLDDLIDHVTAHGPSARAAADELLRSGDAFVETVLRRASDELLPAPPAILDLVAGAATPRTAQRLIAALDDRSYAVTYTAYLALGHLADPRGLEEIAARLLAVEGHVDAHPAATALILAGSPAVLPALRAWLAPRLASRAGLAPLLAREREDGTSHLGWIVSVATAAAACGDPCGAPLVYEIVSLPAAIVRELPDGQAAHASWCLELRHFAAVGWMATLEAAAAVSDEAAELATRLYGELGTRAAIARLVALTGHTCAEVASAAAHWLEACAAAGLAAEPRATYRDRAARWWRRNGPAYEGELCYQRGEPRRGDKLFDALGELYDEPDEALARTLGLRVGVEARRRGITRAAAISELRGEAEERFAAGALYRYGVRANARAL